MGSAIEDMVKRLTAERDELEEKLRALRNEIAAERLETTKRESGILKHLQDTEAQLDRLKTAAAAAPNEDVEILKKRAKDAEDRASYLTIQLAAESEKRALLEAQQGELQAEAKRSGDTVRIELSTQLQVLQDRVKILETAKEEAERLSEQRLHEKNAAERGKMQSENSLLRRAFRRRSPSTRSGCRGKGSRPSRRWER